MIAYAKAARRAKEQAALEGTVTTVVATLTNWLQQAVRGPFWI
jgi:hypothetical protein